MEVFILEETAFFVPEEALDQAGAGRNEGALGLGALLASL